MMPSTEPSIEPDVAATPVEEPDEERENASAAANEQIRQHLERLPNNAARVEYVADLLRSEIGHIEPKHVMQYMEQVGSKVPPRPKVSVALKDWRSKRGIADTDALPVMTDEKLAEHAAAMAAAAEDDEQNPAVGGAVVEFRRGVRRGNQQAAGAEEDIVDAEFEEIDSVAAKAAVIAAEEVAAAAQQAKAFQDAQETVAAIEDPEVRALAQEVLTASGKLAFQNSAALSDVLSPEEQAEKRAVAEWVRRQRLDAYKAAVAAELEADNQDLEATLASRARVRATRARIEESDVKGLLDAREAVAAQRRETSPHARLSDLVATRKWVFRGLVAIMVAGMLWSADNVQKNMSGGAAATELSFWTGYIVEALASLMLIVIMVATHKLSEHGAFDKDDDRGAVIGIAVAEGALLLTMVGLNTYPYLAGAGQDLTAVWTHSIAPAMVAMAVTVHRLLSGRFAKAIANAAREVAEADIDLDLELSTVVGERGKD